MRISVEKNKCSGCHLCEMVCSLFHLGRINPEKSAVRVAKDDLGSRVHTPSVCRQCKKMKCLDEEEVNDRAERKKFIWEKPRAERCPFKALQVFGEHAYHCDLCDGKPRCVEVCTTGALTVSK
jgi:anaerobic carbon-monoxide dehydrogenase iron sulfur subunit